MATMPVSHFTWQVLRSLKRSKKPLTGKQLRIVPSRRTKDGTFLDELVGEGLIQVAGVVMTCRPGRPHRRSNDRFSSGRGTS